MVCLQEITNCWVNDLLQTIDIYWETHFWFNNLVTLSQACSTTVKVHTERWGREKEGKKNIFKNLNNTIQRRLHKLEYLRWCHCQLLKYMLSVNPLRGQYGLVFYSYIINKCKHFIKHLVHAKSFTFGYGVTVQVTHQTTFAFPKLSKVVTATTKIQLFLTKSIVISLMTFMHCSAWLLRM